MLSLRLGGLCIIRLFIQMVKPQNFAPILAVIGIILTMVAKSDKKNVGDGNIKTSVAKRKNEWTILSLPFEDYKRALENAVKDREN